MSAAWKIAAALSTDIDCSIRRSHMVLSRGIMYKSAASKSSMAVSKGICTSSVYRYSNTAKNMGWLTCSMRIVES